MLTPVPLSMSLSHAPLSPTPNPQSRRDSANGDNRRYDSRAINRTRKAHTGVSLVHCQHVWMSTILWYPSNPIKHSPLEDVVAFVGRITLIWRGRRGEIEPTSGDCGAHMLCCHAVLK